MTQTSKPQSPSFRFSILLVMLGLCVFFWGLGYKLSLYDLHQPSIHRIPVAKLLSRNEDSSAADNVRHCLSAVSSEAALLFGAALVGLMSVAASNRSLPIHFIELPAPADLRSHAGLTAFFFRPPPSASLIL